MMLATNESGFIMLTSTLVHLIVIYCTSLAAVAVQNTTIASTTTTTPTPTNSKTSKTNSTNPLGQTDDNYNSTLREPPDRVLLSAKSSVEEAEYHHSTQRNDRQQNVPQEQRIALQIVIVDPPNSTKKIIDNHRRHTNLLIGRRRPYDAIVQDAADKYSPSDKHFYMLDAQPLKENTIFHHKEDYLEDQQQHQHQLQLQQQQQQKLKLGSIKPTKGDSQINSILNHKIELLRTQHKPPWQTINNQHSQAHLPPGRRSEFMSGANRRYRLRFTTLAPSAATTEFFRLISSAHSPVELITRTLEQPRRKVTHSIINNEPDFEGYQQQHQQHQQQRIHLPANLNISNLIGVLTTAAPSNYHMDLNESLHHSRFNPNVSIGHVVSPTIVVMGDKDPDDAGDDDHRRQINENSIEHAGGGNFMSDHREANATLQVANDGQPSFKIPLSASEVPTTFFDGKKKVTIIRHSPRPTRPSLIILHPPTPPPAMLSFDSSSPQPSPPDKIKIEDDSLMSVPNLTITTLQDSDQVQVPTLVRLISKQKQKFDDNIRSPTLTVVDNHAIRLPPNATSVHNNKLIVAIRPGRPKHRYPPTTQFPVYNIVAGITPPYPANPIQHQYTRPPSIYGQVYGLIKPNGTDSTRTTPTPSSFGAQNIKFPAMSPSSIHSEHIEIPENVNISVPDSANFVGPHKVPDKISMGIEELHGRPPDAVVLSDSTVIRPHLSHSFTTRKPARLSTTKRINIMSANTTVIHQTNQMMSQPSRPTPVIAKPSFFEYIGNLLNAGVTTSAVAVLTLIKTIFVAILLMFLPPIALTAAITQAISLG